MSESRSPSIISQMKSTEDAIKLCFYRVESLEKSLRFRHLSPDEREKLEHELEEVKELLKSNESQLKYLRKENGKSFASAVILMFLCFLVYGVYNILNNKNVK